MRILVDTNVLHSTAVRDWLPEQVVLHLATRDGSKLFAGGAINQADRANSRMVTVWDLATNTRIRTFYGPGTDDCTFAASEDGRTLVLAGGGKVQVLDLFPGQRDAESPTEAEAVK